MKTSLLAGTEQTQAIESAGSDAASDITRETLASMFLTCVRQELVRSAAPTHTASAGVAKSDVALTAPSDGLDASTSESTLTPTMTLLGTDAAGGNKELERLEFEFDGGKLGTVALGLFRRDGAIEVVVGVEDPRQMALVDLERASLLSSLKSAGLNIASVSIVSREAAGTAFAQRKRGMNATQQESASEAYRSRRVRQETDGDEGLNLVG